ncbi:MAG TPA: OmpA family protein [Candidatus Kapabacteria bacterium]|nr:OmpA family protein [Candidatus Kapabacteria bacterium]HOV92971.1 OmpA family protein [Candidatus Kapabacteria bacterium]
MNRTRRHHIFKQTEDVEHNTGPDRYLLTYADLITLLLGLFVILYAASQVDIVQFKTVSKALSQVFNQGEKTVLNGGKGELEGSRGVLPAPEFNHNEKMSIEQVYSETQSKLQEYLSKGTIQLKQLPNGMIVTLPEVFLFESGRANLQSQSYTVLDTLASIFKDVPFEISIDGHTDSQPIHTFQYESNWHLSVDRALRVGYYLIQMGVPEKNVIIRGFGPERPISDNLTPEGRAKNRRVEITVTNLSSNTAASTNESK